MKSAKTTLTYATVRRPSQRLSLSRGASYPQRADADIRMAGGADTRSCVLGSCILASIRLE